MLSMNSFLSPANLELSGPESFGAASMRWSCCAEWGASASAAPLQHPTQPHSAAPHTAQHRGTAQPTAQPSTPHSSGSALPTCACLTSRCARLASPSLTAPLHTQESFHSTLHYTPHAGHHPTTHPPHPIPVSHLECGEAPCEDSLADQSNRHALRNRK